MSNHTNIKEITMNLQGGELQCTLAVEQLSVTGEITKKSTHRNILVSLVRNEFKDILLKTTVGKRDLKFNIREYTVFKKFVKDGKATLKLPKQRVQFMFSNCPPDKLILFLKTLNTKVACQEAKGYVPDRQRLLADVPRSLEDISPLNMKELETVHKMRAEKAEKDNGFTPKGKTVACKRKRDGNEQMDKENAQQGCKVAKKIGLLPKKVLSPVILSREQKNVLGQVLQGCNIFFTGSAGTGKSFLLRRIIGALPPQHTFATASTGVAACHIGGTTLHAFAGIGSGQAPLEQCIELANRTQIAQQWRKCRHLIIDEVSMVDGNYFDKLEIVARMVRKSDKPFGGIQLILCGDFLQLPPVSKGKEKKKYAFQSKAWRECIHVNMHLSEVRRQSDNTFIDMLQNIRLGICSSEVTSFVKKTASHHIEKEGILPTRLCTHKEDVNHINTYHLKNISKPSRIFESADTDPHMSSHLNQLCPVEKLIELKEGAQVMLAKNINVETGLVNGARGVIEGFEAGPYGYPIVRFVCGETQTLKPERWTVKISGGLLLSRKQIPLKLAWAISIHKSQGMSLDCVEMSLSKVFECGQAYVALSRARSLQGLRVLDFDPSCVRADPTVLRFYHSMRMGGGVNQQTVQRDDEDIEDHW